MYIPRRYEEKDREKVFSFIKENSFAILVSVSDGAPVATHIPLLLEKNAAGEDILMGHISKGNQQKNTLTDGAKVLAIFPGPHSYVSPRWYTQMQVPTWNYISVHIYGTVKIVEGEALKEALSRLMNNYEHSMPRPVKLEDIPEKTFSDDFRGIIGFEIGVGEIQAAYKLSQNRDEQSFHQVIGELEQGNESAKGVAAEMKEREEGLFKETREKNI
jgi:transcriptional regulator